ncbi:solute carrier family 2, facilitated glucose transporter member 3-like [Babylonia areolata]|uniref:solute carrier family 2, facilitated glucose transporter member 3-like n=1 Tax=Babylonia areolata TaxID=304850 RepID=UPI003FD4F5D1
MGEEEQKTTPILLFSVFISVFGNSFLYGYNIGVVNTPSAIIQAFYNKTYYERNGGKWEEVQNYEEYRQVWQKAQEDNTTVNYSASATVHPVAVGGQELQPGDFGVDESQLLEKWQLDMLWSTTVALFVFFGMIGAFSSAKVADFFGRKKGMILITVIMFVAAILGGIPVAIKSPEVLMLSRVFVGLHSGLNISLCPLYLAEISPKKIRGAIGTCHQLAITIGILFSQILGLREIFGTEELWPILFAFNAVPALVCLVVMPFCPESPRFLLIKKGLEDEARQVLVRIRGTHNVEEEMEEMRVEARKTAGVTNFSIKELVTSPALRLPVIIACLLQVFQQWSGINAVMSYSAYIFEQASVPKDSIPYVIVGTGTINVLCTVVAVPLMEKAGRRPLLLWPTGVMTVSFILLTIFLNLMGKPDLQEHSGTFAIVCIVVAHTYIIGFALGLGPIPFIVVGEIFRQEPRAAAMSLSLAFNWICNFILMMIFPSMKDGMGEYTYVVFSVILGAAIVFIFFFVPETKNKTFDEIANSIAFGRAKGEQKSYAFGDENEPMSNSKV